VKYKFAFLEYNNSVVSGAEIYYNGKHFNLEHLLKISQILNIEISEFLKP
jgi:hypothetical protein